MTKYNYTMVGTASLEDDIKAFVTALIALGANTYVGFFNRSGNLGTAGNYSITVYAEEGTSTFASGYIAFGAGALGKTQYIVSYYKPTGSSEEWNIKKLAIIDDILDNNYNGAFMASSVAWFKTGNLFAYPNAGGFYSSTFLMSDRDGAWTGILKIADDGAGSATATIVSLGGSPRGGEEFYYDETSYCLYFCGTWDRITITQLTGKKADLSITSTTQEEAKQNIKIVPINVVTESDLPKKYIDTGSGISYDTCRIALGLSYPCRFKFEFWAIDNSCYIDGYAYRGSISDAPITRYVGTSGYVINSNAGGTMACYTGTDNIQGTFICTEVKD